MSKKFSFKEKMTGRKKCPSCKQREIPLGEDFCDECKGSGMSDLEREYRKNYPADTRKIIEKNGQLFYEKENLKENESIITTKSRSSISSGDVWFFAIILFFLLISFVFGRNIAQSIFFIIFITAVVIAIGFFVWIHYFTPEKREKRKVEKEEKRRIEEENLRAVQLKIKEEKRVGFEKYKELRKLIEETPKYYIWKSQILERSGGKCENNGCKNENNLQIHHCVSFYKIINHYGINDVNAALDCTALWDIDNGRVFCSDCHKKTNSYKYRNISELIRHEKQD